MLHLSENIVIEYDSSDVDPLAWNNVAQAAMLLFINVVISKTLNLGLEQQIAVAGVRCFIQLTLLGLVLERIFAINRPILVFGLAGLLGGLAALEVSKWKAKRAVKGMFWITLGSIFGSSVAIGLVGSVFALNFTPVYTASKFIPVLGMLYGNTMVGVTLGIDTVLQYADEHRDVVETMLSFGASQWEAARPIVVEAARTAMIPSITAVSITGLIAIPGMMSGQIIGGADVMTATRYQQGIMFMIAASVALGVITSVIAVSFVVIDSQPRLRTDRIFNGTTSANSNVKSSSNLQASDAKKLQKSASRLKAWNAGTNTLE
ncbi:UPF0014-domain-containing protein [Coemansia reversa NRRL 1564]|uniref:UPF0014-domain-containing protein n=1 Tax=Coemansia reversa (strain ATCC 12441 / NRRL 1564) TaxID=763665 RepID=A0A2G5BJP7_COERN|nr:UPF0014-domain-containing protein [Coemansia reversa NRRL 1564]|eukprot:PIA19238.1 UPF0014-domain-containing protein [Coemansia reversa NRRL 1564]